MDTQDRRPRPLRLVLSVLLIILAAMAVYFGPFLVAQFKKPKPAPPPSTRPAGWAQPAQAPGLANFYKVTDGLYRGAQPTAEGMQSLKRMGIKTVVNLRNLHSDRDELEGVQGLRYVHIRVDPFRPEADEVLKFLRLAGDANCAPLYVHCQRGIDRTGMMCAAYRIALCGWTNSQALAEMTQGGFGYDDVFANVPRWLSSLDVPALARQAGLRPAPQPSPSPSSLQSP